MRTRTIFCAIAGAVALVVSSGAQAATTTVSAAPLDSGSPVTIDVVDFGTTPNANIVIDESAIVSKAVGVDTAQIAVMIDDIGIEPKASFLFIDVLEGMSLVSSRQITDANGDLIGAVPFNMEMAVVFDVLLNAALNAFTVNFAGLAELDPNGGSPSIRVLISTSDPAVVPVPAALPLLMSGLFGLSLVSRRRRRAD
ncbi:MAG: hypothetical protein GC152_07485 [Alphaproteobacteria bacterium]|nr:hypothetical protein [Alphaproteobacteria bacterium]